ncbi:MAG: PLP-dependent transferase [Atopobiaceae bacterium]|nr:PLP-dependent transferase [Atopobiaceae bacterium]
MGRTQWRTASDVAQVVANYLRCHPRVEAVRYPGLKSDPLFAKAACTLVGGFGPYVTFRVAGEWHVLHCEEADSRDVVMELERELQESVI